MRMNDQTKYVFALEHIAHLVDLVCDLDDPEESQELYELVYDLERKLERNLSYELQRKERLRSVLPEDRKLGTGVQYQSDKDTIKEGIGSIGRITDQEP
tara:strand:+ start:216 stop:512 length:297 start_codon:yes stop_codon:yes gene_type:complete